MDRVAVPVSEDPLVVVVDADRRELRRLERPPPGEDSQGRVVEFDGAPSGLGLSAGLVDLVADGDEPAVEVQALLLSVGSSVFVELLFYDRLLLSWVNSFRK